jgi:predicted dehydrogenase
MVDASADVAGVEARRRGWRNLPCFGSLTDAIREVDADCCMITSPARFHFAQVKAALEADLHVLVAKPLVYRLDEAEELVLLAEQRKLCLLVDQQRQFMKSEMAVAEWIRHERSGKVGYATYTIHRHRPDMRAFTGDSPFIWEQGVHSFNSLLAVLAQPALHVQAFQFKPFWSTYNGPTVAMGVIEFGAGIPCSYVGTFDSREFSIEARFECERGAVRWIATNTWDQRVEACAPGKVFEPVGVTDSAGGTIPELYNLNAFHAGSTAGGRQVNDGRDNLRTLSMVDAFIRSASTGRREAVKQF